MARLRSARSSRGVAGQSESRAGWLARRCAGRARCSRVLRVRATREQGARASGRRVGGGWGCSLSGAAGREKSERVKRENRERGNRGRRRLTLGDSQGRARGA
jgi:hypothetical protein